MMSQHVTTCHNTDLDRKLCWDVGWQLLEEWQQLQNMLEPNSFLACT
jgi:hypothetical protein